MVLSYQQYSIVLLGDLGFVHQCKLFVRLPLAQGLPLLVGETNHNICNISASRRIGEPTVPNSRVSTQVLAKPPALCLPVTRLDPSNLLSKSPLHHQTAAVLATGASVRNASTSPAWWAACVCWKRCRSSQMMWAMWYLKKILVGKVWRLSHTKGEWCGVRARHGRSEASALVRYSSLWIKHGWWSFAQCEAGWQGVGVFFGCERMWESNPPN